MWFGNIVTMRWWDDLWLNEAFAEFATNWAATRVTSYTDAWVAHLAGEKLKAYLADQGPISHPIRQPVHNVAEASAIFDAITYPKGASVLQQLMEYVGEASFSAGMTAYFARHAWGNTTLQDLIDALARSADATSTGGARMAGHGGHRPAGARARRRQLRAGRAGARRATAPSRASRRRLPHQRGRRPGTRGARGGRDRPSPHSRRPSARGGPLPAQRR